MHADAAESSAWLIVENHSGSRASIFWIQDDGTPGNVIADPSANINVGFINKIVKIYIQPVGDYQQYSMTIGKWTGGWLAGEHKLSLDAIKKSHLCSDGNYRIYIYPSYFNTKWYVTHINNQGSPEKYLPIPRGMFFSDWLQGIIRNPLQTQDPLDAFPGCQHIVQAQQAILPSHVLNVDRYYADLRMINTTYERLMSQWALPKFPQHQALIERILAMICDAYNNIEKEQQMVKEGKSVSKIQQEMIEFSKPYVAQQQSK